MNATKNPVLTIGHSTHALDSFVTLLRRHEVTAVADVRSAPYSRFNPQFNREALDQTLRACGMKYVFLGRELGARSDDPSCYENGRVQYARLARSELFRAGIERVMHGADDHRIALMCAEREPLECHRTLLVARTLDALDVPVMHILSDGRAESHNAAMGRLLNLLGLPQQELYRSRRDLIAEALVRQEQRVAYVDEKQKVDATGQAP
jgi:uncharacterized protein (DUF488 family)